MYQCEIRPYVLLSVRKREEWDQGLISTFQKPWRAGPSECHSWVEGTLSSSHVQADPLCKREIMIYEGFGGLGEGEGKKERASQCMLV